MSGGSLESAAEQLVAAGAMLYGEGLAPGTTGNLSVRVGDRIVCSPTNSRMGFLETSRLSVLSLTGEHLDGPQPTKEVAMHVAAYVVAPDTRAVVHTHARHATAVSCLTSLDASDAIPPVTPYLTMKAGRVGLVPYVRPGDPALGELVAGTVARGVRALLLANHGTLVCAVDLPTAVVASVELEEAAAVHLLLGDRPRRSLTPEEVDALRS